MDSQRTQRFTDIVGSRPYKKWPAVVTTLLQRFEGMQSHLDALAEFPVVTAMQILRNLPADGSLTNDDIAILFAHMPCWGYQVRCNKHLWNPLEQPFADFMTQHPSSVCCWLGQSHPDAEQIKAWLLDQLT